MTRESIEEALNFSLYPGTNQPLRIMTAYGQTGNEYFFPISYELFPADLADGMTHPDKPPNSPYPITMNILPPEKHEVEVAKMPCLVELIPPTVDASITDREPNEALRKHLSALMDSVHATYITGVGVALVRDKTTLVSLMHHREGIYVHPSIAGPTPAESSVHWRFRTPGKPFRLVQENNGISFSTVLSWLPQSSTQSKPDSRSAIIGNLTISKPTIKEVDAAITALQRANKLSPSSLQSVIRCSLSIASMPTF